MQLHESGRTGDFNDTARTLILGSAAGLIALSGAQAADLPVKAKVVEYVRICSLYGAGFFYIPGTDTCIKIGGYLRADVTFNGGAHGAGLERRSRPAEPLCRLLRRPFAHGADGRYRTATEYGVVRTFGQGDFQFNNFGGTNPTTLTTSRPKLRTRSTLAGGYVAVEYLFIQFAGFTFGKSSSAYSTPWNGFPGNINSSLLGGNNTDTGVNNIQYTAEFGNGVGLDRSRRSDRLEPHRRLQPGHPLGDRRQRHRIERLCRHAFARHRRQDPGRSGLGSVPGVGRGA